MFWNRKNTSQAQFSTVAIKVAAKTLGETQSARAALMAALRHDHPLTVSVTMGGAKTHLEHPVIWVFGVTGSCKTHMATAWARAAGSSGHKTCFITTKPGLHNAFPSIESVLLTGSASEDELRNALASPHVPVTMVLVDPVQKTGDAHSEGVMKAATAFIASDCDLIIVDDFSRRPLATDAIEMIAEHARRSQKRVIILADDWNHMRFGLIKENDAVLVMRSVNGPEFTDLLLKNIPWDRGTLCFRHLSALDIGKGVLMSSDGFYAFEGPYDPSSSTMFDAPTNRAITALESSPRATTHTDRLNALALACGFKGWHAVEGRKTV